MFKVRDRVIYTSGNFGDYIRNPVWGGECGEIIGTITGIDGVYFNVDWDNGEDNSYRREDIKLYVKPFDNEDDFNKYYIK